jgi:hypothetical protein
MVTRIVAAAAAVLIAGSAQAWGFRGIQGNGQKTTEAREVPPFERVSMRGSIDAVVKVGPAQSVAITIDSNLMPHVVTRVEDGRLVIETDEDLSWKGLARAEITVPRLRAFGVSGSSDATIEGGTGEDLELSTSGSGDIRWHGEAKALEVATSGSGDVSVSGRADTAEISTSGSGDVQGRDLTVRDAEVRTSGSGDVWLRLAGGTLRASTSGSGDVTWSGDGTVAQARSSGSGEIRRR